MVSWLCATAKSLPSRPGPCSPGIPSAAVRSPGRAGWRAESDLPPPRRQHANAHAPPGRAHHRQARVPEEESLLHGPLSGRCPGAAGSELVVVPIRAVVFQDAHPVDDLVAAASDEPGAGRRMTESAGAVIVASTRSRPSEAWGAWFEIAPVGRPPVPVRVVDAPGQAQALAEGDELVDRIVVVGGVAQRLEADDRPAGVSHHDDRAAALGSQASDRVGQTTADVTDWMLSSATFGQSPEPPGEERVGNYSRVDESWRALMECA